MSKTKPLGCPDERREEGMSIEDPQARYRQLADLLIEAIQRGEFAPGSEFPSEAELSQTYGLSQTTIRDARRLLRVQGYIRVTQGRKAIVRELPVIERDAALRFRIRAEAGARGAYEAELARAGLKSSVDQPDVGLDVPPAEVAELLGIPEGDTALTRARRMYAMKPDDPQRYPVQLATSWLPKDITEGTPIGELDTGPGGTYSRLEEL